MSEQAVDIEYLGGNCPVQAEGTIEGRRFYFRSRGSMWSLEIAPSGVVGDYLSWPADENCWEHFEEWGDTQYAAGWMPDDVAREMIEKGASIWRAKAQGKDQ